MKNVIFFIVLALLTVSALVGWNAIRNNPRPQTETQQPSVTPTGEIGTAVGRTGMGSLTGTDSTTSGGFSNVSKGNTDPNAPVIPTSTQSVKMSITPSVQIASTSTPMPQTGSTIIYTDNGFNPKTLTIKNGTMVKFVNQSTKKMWIISGDVSGGKKLNGLNMGMSVGKNGTYEFQLTQVGTWGFYDQNNQNLTGVVVVN